MDVEKVLEIIRQEAENCDNKTCDAFYRSKYAIGGYWICVEFRFKALHDRIAKEAGLKVRCPVYAFSKWLRKAKKRTSIPPAPKEAGIREGGL